MRTGPGPLGYRPRTGAWIETATQKEEKDIPRGIAPARGRGLKPSDSPPGPDLACIAPARGRGLKLGRGRVLIRKALYRPRTGAWIETWSRRRSATRPARYRPRTGAWIETPNSHKSPG